MSKLNIEQVELQVSRNLHPSLKSVLQQVGYSIPDGYRLCVSLVDASGRKKRSNAGADNWSPDSGRLEVWLEPGDPVSDGLPIDDPKAPSSDNAPQEPSERNPSASAEVQPGLSELIRALDDAESTPGWTFVSLKKFRDEILPSEDRKWLQTDVTQQNVLRYAIDNRLIITNKVANPKDSRFPVTTIRLNRLMPVVQEVLGQSKKSLDFRPIRIKGEPLSATILRERR